jgi:hypothetical protein
LKAFGNSVAAAGKNKYRTVLDVCDRCFEHARNVDNSDTKKALRYVRAGTTGRLGRSVQKYFRRLLYPSNANPYIGGGTIVEAYARTLLTDRNASNERLSTEDYERFWTSGKTPEKFNYWVNRIRVSTLHRRLMISEKGYIGLGGFYAQKGDLIYVLFRCSMPMIIREVGGHYILIGECYVHRIIDGEAITMLKDGKLVQEEFVLH